MLIAPYIGERALLSYFLNKAAASDVKYHLYSNAHTPAYTDTLANYTESVAPGYAAISIPGANWTIATVAGVSSGVAPQITFTITGAGTFDGYYVTDATSATLLWAEEFTAGPISFAIDGGLLQLTPAITLL